MMILLQLIFTTTLIFTYVQSAATENLGQLNLLRGLAVRFFQSTLNSSDTFSSRQKYLEKKQYLTDGMLIGQHIVTSFGENRMIYKNNQMFGFYYDPSYHDMILEFRGYIKAPKSGVPGLSANLAPAQNCDNEYAYQVQTDYWTLTTGLYLNKTDDGYICTQNSSATMYSLKRSENNVYDTYMGSTVTMSSEYMIKDQFYPIVMSTRVSRDALYNYWKLIIDGVEYSFNNIVYYDPQDDFITNDANSNAKFPTVCPHFHDETFEAGTFVTPTSIVPNKCPVSTSSSIVSSSKTSAIESSSTIPSSTVESSSEISSSIVSSTVESSSEISSSAVSSMVESSSEISSSIVSSTTESSSEISSSAVSSMVESSSEISSSIVSSTTESSSEISSSAVSSMVESSSEISSSIVSSTTESSSEISSSAVSSMVESSSEISSSIVSSTIESNSEISISVVSSTIESSNTISSGEKPTSVVSSTVKSNSKISTNIISSSIESSYIVSRDTITSDDSSSLTSSAINSRSTISGTISSLASSEISSDLPSKMISESYSSSGDHTQRSGISSSAPTFIISSSVNSGDRTIISLSSTVETPSYSTHSAIISSEIDKPASTSEVVTTSEKDISTTTLTKSGTGSPAATAQTNSETPLFETTHTPHTTMIVTKGKTVTATIKTTVHNSVTVTYTECPICTGTIAVDSMIVATTSKNDNQIGSVATNTKSLTILTSSNTIPYNPQGSTTATVLPFSDGAYIYTYEPLLLSLAFILAFI